MQFCSSRTLPGQRIALQLLERRRRERERLLLHVAAEPVDEVPRQQRDVAGRSRSGGTVIGNTDRRK